MDLSTNTSRLRLSVWWKVVALGFAVLLVFSVYGLVKLNLPNLLGSASQVPAFMIESHYDRFTDADMVALRRGLCSHEPIQIVPMKDGTTVLMCGGPASAGSFLMFSVTSDVTS
jgi:hypothetical protein